MSLAANYQHLFYISRIWGYIIKLLILKSESDGRGDRLKRVIRLHHTPEI